VKAAVIGRPGPPEALEIRDRPQPALAPAEVLIRVRAAGLNRADLIQRQGHYPAPPNVPADIPGLEVSGTIEAVGAEAPRWKIGDAVCALLGGGGYAEYVSVCAGHCLPVPQRGTLIEAAALPEAVCTVWHNVFQRGGLEAGEAFLVHGGSSGVGLAAIQLARLRGARVFATAGSAEKCQACEQAGAERVINYRKESFEEVLGPESVDVILDMVAGDYVAKNLRILRPEGRMVLINTMAGARAEVDLRQIMSRRLVVTGSTLRSREAAFKSALVAEVERNVWPLIESREFHPNVFKVFSLGAAADAHRLMESGRHIGKIVLEVEN
jgi:NADPH:quinone reductase